MNGLMAESTMVNGKITRWKVTECSRGLMEEDMKVNILTIKKKARVHSIGPMAENMRVIGKMENNTVSEYIHQQLVRPKRVNGAKVKESIGSTE